MTNGGGSPEAAKAQQVSDLLNLAQPIVREQVCVAHTPMRALAAELGEEPVLLVGKHYHKLKEVAESYGFKHAITVEELHARWPHLYPDMPPKPVPTFGTDILEKRGFKAVLAMTDALEWGRELQIVCDVLSANKGDVGAAERSPSRESSPITQHVALHNACADFTYAARWPAPRFGAGAMRVALDHLWLEMAGVPLEQTLYGKPYEDQYRFVETLLAHLATSGAASPIERFYMVGDNPVTDIRGARAAGAHWRSILTRSGLWVGGENDDADPADAVVDDVLGAVKWLLKQEGLVVK